MNDGICFTDAEQRRWDTNLIALIARFNPAEAEREAERVVQRKTKWHREILAWRQHARVAAGVVADTNGRKK